MESPSRRHILNFAAVAPFAGLAGSCGSSGKVQVSSQNRLRAAGSFLDDLVKAGQIAGGAVRVSQYGKVLLTHYSGKSDTASGKDIDAGTIYRAYSMTKPVTIASIMVLIDDGAISLNDPVAKYVPEFSGLSVLEAVNGEDLVTEPAGEMRIHHLLTHTSGLTNSWTPGPLSKRYQKAGLIPSVYPYEPVFADGLPEVAGRLAGIPLQFQPGSQWLYSISPDIAGLVVERIAGQRFGDFLRQRIFEPLGMSDTGFSVPESEASRLAEVYTLRDGELSLHESAEGSPYLDEPYVQSGSAGLVTTLGDYGRFAAMLAGTGNSGSVRILSEKSARTMMSPQVSKDVLGATFGRFVDFATGGSSKGMAMGLGGAVLVDPEASDVPGVKGEYTWGGAASTTFFAVPEMGLEATLMTQLFPSGTLPLRDMLKTAVYRAIAS